MWGWHSLERYWLDVRYALRMAYRTPGFTVVTVLCLALGIGANTALFSLVNAVMLRTLPVREPGRLVELLSRYPGEPRTNGFSWKVYEHFRDHNHVFSDLIGISPARFQVTRKGLEAETVDGEYVVGTFFPALGLRPAIGRLIGPEDDQPGAAGAAVAVLSWTYWQHRFNRDPAVLGTRVVLDGVAATIVGVAPREFLGLQVGLSPDVWVPAAMEPLIQRTSRRANGTLPLGLMGRLKPGVSLAQARAEMAVLDQWRVQEITKTNKDPLLRQLTMEVEPAGAGFSALRDVSARPLLVLMAAVGLLLLIACTNVASMLLARGASREREMAVRVSLGASRWRLVRQVLTESLLLSTAGGLIGVCLAYAGADALVRIIASIPVRGPQRLTIQAAPDAHVLLFTAAVAISTGLLFGLAPAWHAFASSHASSRREIGSAGETRSRQRFGKGLVVAQVALSVVLLSAAGLFVRHLAQLRHQDLGFQRESVLLVTLDPRGSGYDRARLTLLYRQLLDRLERIPGVRAATLSGMTPLSGAGAHRFVNVEGVQESPAAPRVALNSVGPKYFETLGTPLIAGRDFQFEDEGRPRVAIVSLSMARHYFGDASPLGRRVAVEGDDGPYEIVGVVRDAKYSHLREPAPRAMYMNAFQEGRIQSLFSLRTTGAPTAVAREVRRAVHDVLKTVAVAKMTTLADQVDGQIVPERLIATLSGLFGALGVGLAAMGLYGLLAYTVVRRTGEIGVRIALGATGRHVTAMVLKDAWRLGCAGLVLGIPMALWSRRFAARMVDDLAVDTAPPIAFAAAVMIAVALLAAYLPARRAARVSPMTALRQ